MQLLQSYFEACAQPTPSSHQTSGPTFPTPPLAPLRLIFPSASLLHPQNSLKSSTFFFLPLIRPSQCPTAASSNMSAASAPAVAAAYSSISQHSLRSPSIPPSNPPLLSSTNQKSAFHGLQLLEGRRISSIAERERSWGRKGLEISARTAGASKSIEVEVDKPLGLTLGQKPGGGVVITAVDGGGNAAKAGLKAGDQVLYTSSFFGDELWPADKLGFTKTAIQAKPDSVYFVVSRGAEVDVKRLPKRPAPPRFGRKLTEAQKARATHICLDCGFIYTLQKPFDEQPDSYVCPQCNAPKKRFTRYDVKTGKPIGGSLPPIGVIVGLVAGIAAVGALLVYGLR